MSIVTIQKGENQRVYSNTRKMGIFAISKEPNGPSNRLAFERLAKKPVLVQLVVMRI